MQIVVVGAGVQGTLYGVRLARAGHAVTLIARGRRAQELRHLGAVIEHALTGEREMRRLPVAPALTPEMSADLCLVTVRREQLAGTLAEVKQASGIPRALVMVNYAGRASELFAHLERSRVVLGFPGAAGSIENGVDRYVEVVEQPTAVDASASDIAILLRAAGFRVALIRDMESWLCRHAVFVTAVGGALYESGLDVRRLASNPERVRRFISAVREGWQGWTVKGLARHLWGYGR